MTPSMMRRLWSLVDSSQSKLLLELDDSGLVEWLMSQMELRHPSTSQNSQDACAIEAYIRNHLLLIRDIADDSGREERPRSIAALC